MIRKLKKEKEVLEITGNYAVTVLKDAEAVLMKRISRMREGKPRTMAQGRLADVKKALTLIK